MTLFTWNLAAGVSYTSAAYSNLLVTTTDSSLRLITDGPPTLGMRRPTAVADAIAGSVTALMFSVNINFESRVTQKYFTAR